VTGIRPGVPVRHELVALLALVGDIFGAPLAMEGLMAFFLESTFVGLWIFGWGRLSPRVHLACAWLVAFATALSALFHPRRQLLDAAPGRLHPEQGDRACAAEEHLQRALQLDGAARLPAHRSLAPT